MSRKSYLKLLDYAIHGGLRLVRGAFKTSPVESLYAVADETPPNLRCEKLTAQYYTKLKSCPTKILSFLKNETSINKKKKTIEPFGI